MGQFLEAPAPVVALDELGDGGVINDNCFCRSRRWRSVRRGGTREACDTARFPHGGRVGDGCTGRAIAGEADGRQDAGGSRHGGGVSERAARTWQSGPLPSASRAPRTWRTREDPFADVWRSEVVPPS